MCWSVRLKTDGTDKISRGTNDFGTTGVVVQERFSCVFSCSRRANNSSDGCPPTAQRQTRC
eukprot:6769439-Lingulodinium_polyedra.AAC.1